MNFKRIWIKYRLFFKFTVQKMWIKLVLWSGDIIIVITFSDRIWTNFHQTLLIPILQNIVHCLFSSIMPSLFNFMNKRNVIRVTVCVKILTVKESQIFTHKCTCAFFFFTCSPMIKNIPKWYIVFTQIHVIE